MYTLFNLVLQLVNYPLVINKIDLETLKRSWEESESGYFF